MKVQYITYFKSPYCICLLYHSFISLGQTDEDYIYHAFSHMCIISYFLVLVLKVCMDKGFIILLH